MKRSTLTNLRIAAGSAAIALMTASTLAVPVNGLYIEDARCDPVPTQSLSHELGNTAFFPLNEAIVVSVSQAAGTVCVAQDFTTQNDWIVQMTNISGQAWKNLFFVANKTLTIGNADGSVMDVTNAPGVVADAFRIDGTVTVIAGGNNNLLGESMLADEIFAPGETWRFNVSNFNDPNNTAFPQIFFNTPGTFGGSAPVLATFPDTASILAQPVPEPATLGAFGLIAASLLMRRPSRRTA